MLDPQTPLDVIRAHQFMSLATFRKSGVAVATPVTYAVGNGNDKLYVVTGLKTGKVKRLRNSSAIEVAPCDQKGKLLGVAYSGVARIMSKAEGKALLKQVKFGAPAPIMFIFNLVRIVWWGGVVYVEISLD